MANLILRTTVVKGRDLAAKDRSGTSDPFMVLTLGDAKSATSVINRTLNPEWNQTLDLPIQGVQSLVLTAECWDKDRFGKDYMGEFDVALEDIFVSRGIEPEGTWHRLESRRTGKKDGVVTGEVYVQFKLVDPSNSAAPAEELLQKLSQITSGSPSPDEDEDTTGPSREDSAEAEDTDGAAAQDIEKQNKKKRLAKLKRKATLKAYEFSGVSEVAGVLFLEIVKATDLPPEKNMTRTSFDMDPFVVTSLGKKTYRTKVIRHNLNPIFEEKLVFQVLKHETNYSLNFAVVDRDKLSNNDFVGTCNLPLESITKMSPEADPNTGLYKLPDPQEFTGTPEARRSRFRIPMSRSSSSTSITRLSKPTLKKSNSQSSISGTMTPPLPPAPTSGAFLDPNAPASNGNGQATAEVTLDAAAVDDQDLHPFTISLDLKNKDRWEAKSNPQLTVKAKYLPYKALRQQFWRAMLKHYDADESCSVDKVELTTMLDTLGSTLHESTINGFFSRFEKENNGEQVLTFDQAVVCLEDQLQESHNNFWPSSLLASGAITPGQTPGTMTPQNRSQLSLVPAIETAHLGKDGEEGTILEKSDDLADEKGEEHVVEIRECPICHQPRLNKKSDADIITHVATCASQDWRQVNNIVMAGFVTSSQAQRNWYTKVITKIGYGGYKLGANSANILVQDRTTGQINEEKMSVYVRLGIRLLYKGLKSNNMEKKRIRKLLKSLSIKQGKKYDDPASAAQIEGFIEFHNLNMAEVLLPIDQFKTFNEFFYRALKPDARPCSAPDDTRVITSPADCRSVVFNRMTEAQSIWVKGREFTVERLLGKGYPEDAKRFVGGALGIFRLAPQDYHRFHIPVDGIMGEPKLIEGEYYTVNPMAIRSALDVYGENIRTLVPIDSVSHGRVMVICVGAMMVGSTVITRNAGDKVARAEELGYFKFGGSTILLLFEPGVMQFDDDLVDNSSGALETLISVGMSIGHSPERQPHTEDMRKASVTQEEKLDAKRRIGGSLAS